MGIDQMMIETEIELYLAPRDKVAGVVKEWAIPVESQRSTVYGCLLDTNSDGWYDATDRYGLFWGPWGRTIRNNFSRVLLLNFIGPQWRPSVNRLLLKAGNPSYEVGKEPKFSPLAQTLEDVRQEARTLGCDLELFITMDRNIWPYCAASYDYWFETSTRLVSSNQPVVDLSAESNYRIMVDGVLLVERSWPENLESTDRILENTWLDLDPTVEHSISMVNLSQEPVMISKITLNGQITDVNGPSVTFRF
jgi:hypothetical protein